MTGSIMLTMPSVTDECEDQVLSRPESRHTGRMRAPRIITTCLVALLSLTGPLVGSAVSSAHEEPTPLEQDDAAHLLAVVTKQRPIVPLDYAPQDLVTWPGTDFRLRAEVAEQLEAMFDAAQESDLHFRVVSGYRSYDTQAGTFDYWARQSGSAAAEAVSARPGHSEHQTGLAADLDNTTGECYLDPCFGETDEGRWVQEHAHEFGFIVSYPEGAEQVTGYSYEPWHIRYVGPQVAEDMHRRNYRVLSTYLAPPAVSVRIGELLGSRG